MYVCFGGWKDLWNHLQSFVYIVMDHRQRKKNPDKSEKQFNCLSFLYYPIKVEFSKPDSSKSEQITLYLHHYQFPYQNPNWEHTTSRRKRAQNL